MSNSNNKHLPFKFHWPAVVVCNLIHIHRIDRRARIVGHAIHMTKAVKGGGREKLVLNRTEILRIFNEVYPREDS